MLIILYYLVKYDNFFIKFLSHLFWKWILKSFLDNSNDQNLKKAIIRLIIRGHNSQLCYLIMGYYKLDLEVNNNNLLHCLFLSQNIQLNLDMIKDIFEKQKNTEMEYIDTFIKKDSRGDNVLQIILKNPSYTIEYKSKLICLVLKYCKSSKLEDLLIPVIRDKYEIILKDNLAYIYASILKFLIDSYSDLEVIITNKILVNLFRKAFLQMSFSCVHSSPILKKILSDILCYYINKYLKNSDNIFYYNKIKAILICANNTKLITEEVFYKIIKDTIDANIKNLLDEIMLFILSNKYNLRTIYQKRNNSDDLHLLYHALAVKKSDDFVTSLIYYFLNQKKDDLINELSQVFTDIVQNNDFNLLYLIIIEERINLLYFLNIKININGDANNQYYGILDCLCIKFIDNLDQKNLKLMLNKFKEFDYLAKEKLYEKNQLLIYTLIKKNVKEILVKDVFTHQKTYQNDLDPFIYEQALENNYSEKILTHIICKLYSGPDKIQFANENNKTKYDYYKLFNDNIQLVEDTFNYINVHILKYYKIDKVYQDDSDYTFKNINKLKQNNIEQNKI